MSLYVNNLQPNIIPSFIKSDTLSNGNTSVPAIDGIVTSSDDEKSYSIALVNKHPSREAACNLGIDDINGNASIIVLSGDSPNAFNDVGEPNRVVPVKRFIVIKNGNIILPAHSLVILNIKRPH
jgi:alpha-L-arabinofuranosidase